MSGTALARRSGWTLAVVVGLLVGTMTTGARAQEPWPGRELQSPEIPGMPPWQPPALRQRPSTARLILAPSRIEVGEGSLVRLSLSVLGARDISRFPVTLRYDPEILRPATVRLSKAWDSGPKPVLLHDAGRPGELVIGVARLGSTGPGINGTSELLRIEFRALRPGNTEIRMERFALIGAGSIPQPAKAGVAIVTVR